MRPRRLNPAFLCNAEYAGEPRMGILDVVDWIFGRLPFRQVQIEIKMAIGSAHEKEKLRRIGAHLIHHFAHGDKLAGAL
jgi:hypothetical protein